MSKYPDLFDTLAEQGHGYEPWSREDLKKLAGLNFIRVFKDVERVRDELKGTKIIEDPIPYDEMIQSNPNVAECRTDIGSYKPSPVTSKTIDDFEDFPA